MRRRNVSALACGLLALLTATTVAFAGLSTDAVSEKQEAAKEVMAAGHVQNTTNLAAKGTAGIAGTVNTGNIENKSIKEDMSGQASKAVGTISGADLDQKIAAAEIAAKQEQQDKEAQWEGRAIASNVEEYVNIRAEASDDSEVVGRLVKGAAGDVLEQGDDWTYLSSGVVEGYVSNEYLAFGAEALEVAEAVCNYVAVADGDMISIRQKPEENAEILAVASEGEKFEVVEDGNDWVKVVSGEDIGYMSKEVVNVKLDLAVAVPVEPEITEDSGEKPDTEAAQPSADEAKEDDTDEEEDHSVEESVPAKEPESSEEETSSRQTSSGSAASHSGTFKVTAYCACARCCGSYANGYTATGTKVTAGRTIAVDKNVIPLGTTVYIDGVPYVAEDTGVHGNTIDLYMDSHAAALSWGVQYCTVTW